MKQLLITIAAVMLVGCVYVMDIPKRDIALIDAVETGSIKAVKIQLDAGASVNPRGIGVIHSRGSALHVVENKEIAELLIAKGANVNAHNVAGETPLHRTQNKEIFKILIRANANVNTKDELGWTPLHHVAYRGQNEIAKLLIHEVVELNSKNNRGKTPLDVSIWAKNQEIADLLRKHGAKTAEELKAEGK